MNTDRKKYFIVPRATPALFFKISVLIGVHLSINFSVMAQNTPCGFDPQTLQFNGSPVEQARCLLRPNRRGGVLGERLAKLPPPLEKLIGRRVKIEKERLRRRLQKIEVAEEMIGGPLDEPLAEARTPAGATLPALYFVIHDTSWPYLKDESFPPDFERDPLWRGNDLSVWLKNPVAHVFVNRRGESSTATPFAEAVKKGWGTKFAREYLKADGKALQLHIELVQPRRRDAAHPNSNNDLIAPEPGFTIEQYDRLAVLYLAASIRRGSWLIPAYHSAIDAGIKDAHDDPQNFDLSVFAGRLSDLIKSVK